jgi:hypothetical protein
MVVRRIRGLKRRLSLVGLPLVIWSLRREIVEIGVGVHPVIVAIG